MNILEKIHQMSKQFPTNIAFSSPDREITYQQLWEQSERVAAGLLSHSITRQTPILVYGHMDPNMLVAFLGSVKAGLPYIPVDISIPPERIQKIINQAKPAMILSTEEDLGQFTVDVPIIPVHQLNNMNVLSSVDQSNWVTEDENFYILFTSGSTGNPKGVQISFNNLNSFVEWMHREFPINTGKNFINQAPFSFDLSVMDIYPCLTSGGTLTALTKTYVSQPKKLFEYLQTSNCNVWTSTPSFVQLCLMSDAFNQMLLPNLDTFLFCGETLPPDVARTLLDRFPNAQVYNTYGPTETTVAVTKVEITKTLLNTYQVCPIGHIGNNAEMLIVNEHGEETKEGEAGELIITGHSVSKGYLGEPALTNQSFSTINKMPAYATGDMVYKKDGYLFYKGRLDFQIKLNGYRMELEEIEHKLAQSQYVEQCVVVPVYENSKVTHLSAYVIANNVSFEKSYQRTNAIKKELATFLPNYMIPRIFKYVDNIPMTANGKINRKLLAQGVHA